MAQALGFFESEGLAVKLVPGGPNANVRIRVATGRAEFGQVEGNNAMLAIEEGVTLRIVAALFQHDPSVLLMHKFHEVQGFEDLDGKRLKARPQWAFLDYVRKKYQIQFELTPVDFGLEVFASNPDLIQQGYYIAEPFYLDNMGIETTWLHVWDSGYDSLSAIISNPEFLEKHREETRAFLRAYYMGQVMYYNDDPKPAHDLILEKNENATREFLNWSRNQIISESLAQGDPQRGGAGDYLFISAERIQKQIQQLVFTGAIERDSLNVDDVFDGRFLPQNYPREK